MMRSALPILRKLGTEGHGTTLLKSVQRGDFSILKVWVGLETRKLLQASVESVEMCVRYAQLSPNI
jgi:aarF domain-containing kinase